MKISKFIKQEEIGFTLVELLVVMMIIAVIGSVVGTILLTSFRGQNKTTALTVIRQNGNYAITQISKKIRGARSFNGISTDGVTYVTDCIIPSVGSGTPTPVPPQYKYLKITNFDGSETTVGCYLPPSPTPGNITAYNSDSTELYYLNTADNTQNPVALNACSLTCFQNSVVDPPTIGINFSLSQKGSSTFFENNASIDFQTSIVLRNVNR